MDEITKEFLVESHENLDRLDHDLLALEKNPACKETLDSIFGTLHTLKGTTGFLGFSKLEAVSHVGETLLSKMREGLLTLNPSITSALLALVDAVRFMLSQIEQTGQVGDRDYSPLIGLLTSLSDPRKDSAFDIAGAARTVQARTPSPPNEEPQPSNRTAFSTPLSTSPNPALGCAQSLPLESELAFSASETAEVRNPSVAETTIRVDVRLLDKLMNLVSELVLTRNQMLQLTTQRGESSLLVAAQRLNRITTNLQESVMKTRMQPIGTIWSKLPRLVRDLATACSKEVRIEMDGEETELDKTIIEAIKDPLTHVVRNSVDHGIELAEVRVSHGKPAEGVLRMRAFHEGGQVHIEITDDGAGISCERVRRKALQRGLIGPDQAARMSDHESLQLIFSPGFSTAEKVTSISGRGVGMDVVKTNVERIGGTVDIQSQPGKGTTLRIRIPLTLAIIPALIVSICGERFAIPQISLIEIVRLDPLQARGQIEFIRDTPLFRLRDQLLPLLYLNRELRLNEPDIGLSDEVSVVVLHAKGQRFGLVVGEVNDTEEIVVKPLGGQLNVITPFVGATIMGDGRVALILDAAGLARGAGMTGDTRRHLSPALAEQQADAAPEPLLVFEAGEGSRMAIPLSKIVRLEEIPRDKVEYSGQQEVLQYRGQIIPLIHVADAFATVRPRLAELGPTMQVVIFAEQGRSVGLVVDRISDIIEEVATTKSRPHRGDFSGSVVLDNRVTDLLDVPSIIRTLNPAFYSAQPVSRMAA